MLWNRVLLVYDGSESALRAVEYVAKMFGRTEGIHVTIFGVHEKIPRHDFKDTSPVVDKLQRQISSMQIEIERGQARIKESKALLARSGVAEGAISIKYVERKQSGTKDVLAEVKEGGYGTVVVGRSESKGLMLTGGDIAKDLIGASKDFSVCVV